MSPLPPQSPSPSPSPSPTPRRLSSARWRSITAVPRGLAEATLSPPAPASPCPSRRRRASDLSSASLSHCSLAAAAPDSPPTPSSPPAHPSPPTPIRTPGSAARSAARPPPSPAFGTLDHAAAAAAAASSAATAVGGSSSGSEQPAAFTLTPSAAAAAAAAAAVAVAAPQSPQGGSSSTSLGHPHASAGSLGSGASGVRNVDLIELRALRAKFAELDYDQNGVIDRDAFCTLFASVMQLPDEVAPEERKALLDFAYELFEPTGSGTLHLRQFIAGCVVLTRGTETERLRYLFQMYDSDGSGGLNLSELVRVFRVMKSYAGAKKALGGGNTSVPKPPVPGCGGDAECEAKHLAAKALREHDLDHDGHLRFDEFARWCAEEPDTKAWLDMLSMDTAKGVARLREEREKRMIIQELSHMGFGGGDDVFRESYSLVEAAASSSGTVIDPMIFNSVDYPRRAGSSTGASGDGDGIGAGGAALQTPQLRRALSNREHTRSYGSSSQAHAQPPPGSVTQSSHTTDEDGRTDESQQRGSSLQSSLNARETEDSPYQVQRSVSGRPAGPFEIDFESLTFVNEIGEGSFARVWRGKWLDIPVAIKILKSGPKLRISATGSPMPAVADPASQPSAGAGDAAGAPNAPSAVDASEPASGVDDPVRANARMYGGSILDETLEPEMASNYGLESQGGGLGRDSVSATVAAGAVRDRNHFLREIGLLTSLRHPNVLLLMGACTDPRYPLCIVSELVAGGSLQSHLDGPDRELLSHKHALKLALDIARGMLYLHSSKPIVLHRDLKAANILVENFDDYDSSKAIIIDFGLSRLDSTTDSRVGGMAGGLVGSLVTMAPECMRSEMYQPASDVYSFAIIMLQLFSRRQPFQGINALQLMYKVGVEGKRPDLVATDKIPVSVMDLIVRCWAQNPKERPEFESVVADLNAIHKDLFETEVAPPPPKPVPAQIIPSSDK